MNDYSPEIQKTLKTLIIQTQKGNLSWEVTDYEPICFMPEINVEDDGYETENYALKITFHCRSPKGRSIRLESYESVGFLSGDGFTLRGLGYYILRFFSSDDRIIYQFSAVLQSRKLYPLLISLADAIFTVTRLSFFHMKPNNPAVFLRHLHIHDQSGGLETHPFSLLMAEFYQHNRCRDFHLLTMSCMNG